MPVLWWCEYNLISNLRMHQCLSLIRKCSRYIECYVNYNSFHTYFLCLEQILLMALHFITIRTWELKHWVNNTLKNKILDFSIYIPIKKVDPLLRFHLTSRHHNFHTFESTLLSTQVSDWMGIEKCISFNKTKNCFIIKIHLLL